jgi:hypothetical protein
MTFIGAIVCSFGGVAPQRAQARGRIAGEVCQVLISKGS